MKNMAGNLNSSKLKRMVKSKGFVTAVCALLAVVVLLVAYNIRVNNATKPVTVPVAKRKLTARHLITDEDFDYVTMPRGALAGDYYADAQYIVNNYVNVDTTIPEGSLFYRGAIVSGKDLPDEALMGVKEGETLYYLTVNMLTSYTNSILPNRYIDIYISTKDTEGKALVGKLIRNVKVLQVKTSDGRNVFENSEETRIPYVIMFSLPEEQHLLLGKINAINKYSISSGGTNASGIDIIPIPTNNFAKSDEEDIPPEIASKQLEEYILNLAAIVIEDPSEFLDFIPNQNYNNEDNDE